VLARNARSNTSFEIETDGPPAYAEGARVRTLARIDHPHTRLPRYARDRSGTVIAQRGHHAYPDEGARGNHVGGHLYTVCFDATELGGPGANPRDTVTLDLWEAYLVPA